MSDNNPLLQLRRHGQSVWLDNLTRNMILDGSLEKRIREDGLSGITSNPKIFEEAITGSDAYDEQIREVAARDGRPVGIFEELAVRDVRAACDLLRGVHEDAGGQDGFVSLEVSPHLARDTEKTIDEALRLWRTVDRRNLFIKIPGTAEGLPAIEACLARGVNVNITLLFSLDRYHEVVEAWFRALETRRRRGEPLNVRSVASFFLSRIDVKVDKMLDETAKGGGDKSSPAKLLRGRVAIASAKLAYQIWKEMYADSSERWKRLREAGAAPQKLLWASTSTKDPSYSDVKYVETLIGPHTINTMPDETLEAFRDHGTVEPTLERRLEEQHSIMRSLAELGIDIRRVTDELEREGIDKFAAPFDELLHALEEKTRALAAGG